MKRWIFNMALCLCVCLLVAGLCGRADAADIVASGRCGDYLTWTLDSEGTLTVSGTGEMGNYSKFNRPWISRNSTIIKNVIIVNGVTSIGNYAFYHCNSLTSITLPDSVTSIGNSAFEDCTGLTNITIPDGVTSIGNYAFNYCAGLTSITIPDSVTQILGGVFSGCTGLTGIWVGEGNLNYSNDEKGVLYNKEKTELIQFPGGLSGTYAIPDGVMIIGSYAFKGCTGLTSITIPDSVTSIGNRAFYWCRLGSIFFNGDAPTIATDAFYGVDACAFYPAGNTTWGSKKQNYGGKLYWLEMDPSKEIVASGICGENMVWQVSKGGKLLVKGSGTLTDFSLWESYKPMIQEVSFAAAIEVPTIPANSFSKCRLLRTVTLPDGVTSIGNSAFDGCSSLTSITTPDGVTSIGDRAFYGCESLASITIPDGVTSIGDYAFSCCESLTSITIPGGVTSIGDYAFSCCESLTSITIPSGVTSIGAYAFSGCESLTSITIPDSVTSIDAYAFSRCSSLTGIRVGEGNLHYSNDEKGALYDKEKTELIQCPGGLSGTYAVPDSVTYIGWFAFEDCTGLTSITIPDSVTYIGNYAFSGCSSLTSITIPESVISIENGTFSGCSSLTSITIPDSVTNIGDKAFYCCTALTSITIPNGVSNIEGNPFWQCHSLKVVVFLGEKPNISSTAFEDVNAVAYYPESLDSDSSWKKSGALSDYGGTLTWKPWYTLGNDLLCEHVLEDTVVPPSCTGGYTLHKCICGYSYHTDFKAGIGHDMVIDKAIPATCTEDGLTEGNHCSRCNYKVAQEVTPKLGHDMITDDAAVPATCTETGLTEGSHCTRCDYKIAQEVTPKLGHNMITDAAVPATCTETGLTEGGHCSRCDYKVAQEITPALGHDYIDHAAKAATCTEVGWNAYQTCSRCDYTTYQEIPAPGHDMIVDAAVPATCTETGLTEGSHCSRCDYKVTQTVVAAPGHDWGTPTYVWSADNSAITATHVCKRDTAHKETEKGKVSAEVTKEATYDAEGEITYTATFTNPAFRTQVKTVTTPKLEETKPTENPFTDVGSGMYYTVPVLWAVENRVTAGTSATTFGPNDGCTRAQVVTFLWRAAGQPEPTGSRNPFTDVSSSAYYYKAVLWAVENGITAGTSATTFSPDGTCTRAQIVTFLWRYEGMPAPTSAGNSFVDVPTGAYYEKAVLWAAQSNVTAGTSATTFSPDSTCTRAQVVTFLYRDVKK